MQLCTGNKSEWKFLSINKTQIVYPYGKCVVIDMDQNVGDNSKVIEFGMEINTLLMEENGISELGVYFKDPGLSFQYLIAVDKLIGDKFLAGFETVHILQTHVKKQLENDPLTQCKNYESDLGYVKCREADIADKFRQLVGCWPLWFTWDEHCGHLNNSKVRELSNLI